MKDLLERFLRYVSIDTTAREDAADYPSSPGQLELGRLLVKELQALGLAPVGQDAHGIVRATLPGNAPEAPAIAWLAHLDTSPETSGAGVRPVVHRNYAGGDLILPGDPGRVLRVAENEDLAGLKGKTLITSDGTTLLGADDKAGVAVAMAAAARMAEDPHIPHGRIEFVFTCDEEVGRGVDFLDVGALDTTVAYTLDGQGAGLIENETFAADLAEVVIRGCNAHPGSAAGKMVNAVRLAGHFLARLPWGRLAPENARAREGFMHPYRVEGGVEATRIQVLLRSFEAGELAAQAELLRRIAANLQAEQPGASFEVNVTAQYRNMRAALEQEPRAVALASGAMRRVGLKPRTGAVRGGTDGARLTAKGLPTPNLSVGMHNVHSHLEYACLEEMHLAVQVLLELAGFWARERREK